MKTLVVLLFLLTLACGVIAFLIGTPLGFVIGLCLYAGGVGRKYQVRDSVYRPKHNWVQIGAWLTIAAVTADIGLAAWATTKWDSIRTRIQGNWADVTPPAAPEVQPMDALALGEDYLDPKGRFRCLRPRQSSVLAKQGDARSNLKFHLPVCDIAVLARETTAETILPPVVDEVRNRLTSDFGKAGIHVARSSFTLGEYLGMPAVVAEIEIDRPKPLWCRQYKVIKHGRDHVIGLYVEGGGDRADISRLFDEFLAHYEPLGAEQRPPGAVRSIPAAD